MPHECPAVPGVALKTPPFPPKTTAPFATSAKLDGALKAAVDAAIKSNVRFKTAAVALVSLEKPGAHPMAHHNGEDTYFGASMVKAAALWGLFQLRATLRAVAREIKCKPGSEDEALMVCGEHVAQAVIASKAKLPALAKAKQEHLVPLWDKAFRAVTGPGGELTIDFHRDFAPSTAPPRRGYTATGHIEKMTVYSDNGSSAACIRACGYGYLNGALASAGFLEAGPGDKVKGIWLAGDYAAKGSKGKYPAYYAQGAVSTAQGASALAFARMLALLDDGTLFDKDADAIAGMREALAKGAAYPNTFYDDQPPSDFGLRLTHTKFGYAEIDHKLDIHSEAAILEHVASGKRFALVWMNLPGGKQAPIEFQQIAVLARDAIGAYVR